MHLLQGAVDMLVTSIIQYKLHKTTTNHDNYYVTSNYQWLVCSRLLNRIIKQFISHQLMAGLVSSMHVLPVDDQRSANEGSTATR